MLCKDQIVTKMEEKKETEQFTYLCLQTNTNYR